MSYTPPTKAAFIEAFPSFTAVIDAAYDLWSGRAGRVIDGKEDCLGADADLAAMLLTAHYLTLQGFGTGAEAEMAAQGMGSFKSIKSGSLSLERGDTGSSSGGEFASTSYGQQAWAMIAPCVSGPRVTGTGSLVGGCGFNGFAGPLPPWQV